MKILPYKPEYTAEIIELFRQTIHSVCTGDYSQPQLDAWAPAEIDSEAWERSLSAHYTVVAMENSCIVGFGDMTPEGYFDRMFVHRDFQRRGIAAAIADALESYAFGQGNEAISVHVSKTAKPFFLSRGYTVVRPNKVECRGQVLDNFVMEKQQPR